MSHGYSRVVLDRFGFFAASGFVRRVVEISMLSSRIFPPPDGSARSSPVLPREAKAVEQARTVIATDRLAMLRCLAFR